MAVRPERDYLSRDQINERAEAFLAEFHPKRTLPVPIESIVEFGLKIGIVHGFALEDITADGIDAYLSQDLQEIRVQTTTAHHNLHRYRFSLAHEAAHVVLHPAAFKQAMKNINTVGEYRDFMRNIDRRELGFIEWQANEFAGRVLVPKTELATQFDTQCTSLGLDKENCNSCQAEAMVPELQQFFDVSSEVIRIRLANDKLIKDL